MHSTSVPLLLLAAGTVGFLHSILPEHWMPLAVVARTQRWSLAHTAATSLLASAGHVVTSIVLGAIIAAVGLRFRSTFETQQGHIVGAVLILTGIGFALWGLTGHGHHHSHDHDFPEHGIDALQHSPSFPVETSHVHGDEHDAEHAHQPGGSNAGQSLPARVASVVVPFGAAASPDLTILPVFLAASAVGTGAVIGVLSVFSLVTLLTFVVLTVGATLAGYQVKGDWLEKHGSTVIGIVLIGIGVIAFIGL